MENNKLASDILDIIEEHIVYDGFKDGGGIIDGKQDAVEAIVKYIDKISRWISVSDRFPSHYNGVLVLLPNGYITRGRKLFDEDKFIQADGKDFKIQPIKWQPLPSKD